MISIAHLLPSPSPPQHSIVDIVFTIVMVVAKRIKEAAEFVFNLVVEPLWRFILQPVLKGVTTFAKSNAHTLWGLTLVSSGLALLAVALFGSPFWYSVFDAAHAQVAARQMSVTTWVSALSEAGQDVHFLERFDDLRKCVEGRPILAWALPASLTGATAVEFFTKTLFGPSGVGNYIAFFGGCSVTNPAAAGFFLLGATGVLMLCCGLAQMFPSCGFVFSGPVRVVLLVPGTVLLATGFAVSSQSFARILRVDTGIDTM